jgi:hypothetical protein
MSARRITIGAIQNPGRTDSQVALKRPLRSVFSERATVDPSLSATVEEDRSEATFWTDDRRLLLKSADRSTRPCKANSIPSIIKDFPVPLSPYNSVDAGFPA